MKREIDELPLVKNYLTRDLFPKKYEINTMPSETVPDQSLSMRQILDRYARGLPLDVKVPVWNDDDEFNPLPDIRTLDLSERDEILKAGRAELEEIKQKIANKRKKAIIEPEIVTPPNQLEN